MNLQKGKISKIYALDGDKFKFRYNWAPRVGGNGYGLSEENVSYTLNTIDQLMVAIVYGRKGNQERGKRHGVREGC